MPANGSDRRQFLSRFAGGLGMAGLLSLLEDDGILAVEHRSPDQDALAPRPPHFAPRARNCIYIFLGGGTSQIELFDPKPKLNELHGQPIPESFLKGVRFAFLEASKSFLMGCPFRFRRYGSCGMEMSELLPNLGRRADDIALVRSMHHPVFAHAQAELEVLTGRSSAGHPTAGAWLTYGLGSPSRELPAYVVLVTGELPTARSLTWGNGYLPSVHRGVVFRNQGEPILDLQDPPGVLRESRLGQLDALARLNQVHQAQTNDPEVGSRIAAYELAFRMQAAAPTLTDLSLETASTHRAYGTDRHGDEGDFGRNCLLARRLVERGVRFVSLMHRKWDHHKNLVEFYPGMCREIDQPIGALISDLKSRGLLDSTLVVVGTEFGRTALTENVRPGPGAGRDHHPFAYSICLAGGGVKGGQVIGKTDELAWSITEAPVHIHDFNATLLHLFGLDHLRLTYRYKGLDIRLTDQAGKIVPRLLG